MNKWINVAWIGILFYSGCEIMHCCRGLYQAYFFEGELKGEVGNYGFLAGAVLFVMISNLLLLAFLVMAKMDTERKEESKKTLPAER